jgi:site-specific recombinase XerD
MNEFFKDIKTIERMNEGPMGHYIARYAAQLHVEGYARQSGRLMLEIVAGFVRWLNVNHVRSGQIKSDHAKKYLRFRKRRGYQPNRSDHAALARWLKQLQGEGVIAVPVSQQKITPAERVLEDYDKYLHHERSLSLVTRLTYRPLIREFLISQFGTGRVKLSRLRALDVINHVLRVAKQLSTKRAQLVTSALRSFLGFARFRGDLTLDLAACVPSVSIPSLSALPKSLPQAHVERVLAHCCRTTAVGRRDYAVLLLLARLGLRAGEVVNLKLEDIQWENSRMTIRSKGGRADQLPLPAEVGEAIAQYLKHDRPRSVNTRRLFLRVKAPLAGFKGPSSVSSLVKHALARTGIESVHQGAHQFRHSLACEMLRHGHTLSEIGEILRHRSPQTTVIYAKVDLISLRKLALPWPGGAQ